MSIEEEQKSRQASVRRPKGHNLFWITIYSFQKFDVRFSPQQQDLFQVFIGGRFNKVLLCTYKEGKYRGTSLIDSLLTLTDLSGSQKWTTLARPWKGGQNKLTLLVDLPHQASMSIKQIDVGHQLGQEKTQPRVTPFSCWDTHSPQETPLTNKQT